jgi:hypothetical protein
LATRLPGPLAGPSTPESQTRLQDRRVTLGRSRCCHATFLASEILTWFSARQLRCAVPAARRCDVGVYAPPRCRECERFLIPAGDRVSTDRPSRIQLCPCPFQKFGRGQSFRCKSSVAASRIATSNRSIASDNLGHLLKRLTLNSCEGCVATSSLVKALPTWPSECFPAVPKRKRELSSE